MYRRTNCTIVRKVRFYRSGGFLLFSIAGCDSSGGLDDDSANVSAEETRAKDISARRVEVMLRQYVGPVDWTTSYTLSKVELAPPGTEATRPVDWDRRHQLMTRLAWSSNRASVHLTWWGGTGLPNPYARYVPREPIRLDPYHRLDLGASLKGRMGQTDWTVRASLVNAYDRNNPWYRTPEAVWTPDGSDLNRRPEFDVVFLDVYDLGVRPSITASIRW